MTEQDKPQLQDYFLRPGYIYVPRYPTLISTVVGSCVAVCLWDRKREYGGMNHFLYPLTRNRSEATAQYGNVATAALVRIFLEQESCAGDLEAQLFGGAVKAWSDQEAVEVSRNNVDVARGVLRRAGIQVVSEDVGGNKGRKIVYNNATNELLVVRVETLRQGDWYPYEGRR